MLLRLRINWIFRDIFHRLFFNINTFAKQWTILKLIGSNFLLCKNIAALIWFIIKLNVYIFKIHYILHTIFYFQFRFIILSWIIPVFKLICTLWYFCCNWKNIRMLLIFKYLIFVLLNSSWFKFLFVGILRRFFTIFYHFWKLHFRELLQGLNV